MSKNTINFKKMSEEAKKQLKAFKDTAVEMAKEDIRHKDVMKPLKARLQVILENRENDLAQGMTLDDVLKKHSRVEVDKAIAKAEAEHKAIVEPLNKAMKDTYVFIPKEMYPAYQRKISEGKRGDYLNAINSFLENLGLEDCRQGQISKFAERMSDLFGARYANAKAIVESGKFHTEMSKAQFSKLFMAVFCDLFVE